MRNVKAWAKWIAIILAALFLLVSVVPAFANEMDDLANLRNQMDSQRQRSDQAQQAIDDVAGKLQILQVQMDQAQSEYKSIENSLKATDQKIAENTELLKKTEKNLAQRMIVLNHRMRDIYKNGQISYLDVLVGATDFSDLTTRMDFLERILDQDASLIKQVRAEKQLIIEKKNELEQDRANQIRLKQEAAEKKNIIAQGKKQQEQLLENAVHDKATADRAYEDLQARSRQIEAMIRRQQNRPSELGGGALSWPLNGTITSPFGWRTHPVFGGSRFHSGIDIGADFGDPVYAAAAGTVIYADWMGGYGYAVIIDHGGGISTLYGHNSSLLVSEGQHVSRSQEIAEAGSTGYSTGPHVHFEVRENGTPVDPMGYLQ